MRRVMRNAAGSITRESRPSFIERIQAELPHPRNAVARAAQDERPIWLDGGNRKSLTASDRDLVTNGQALKLRQDTVYAPAIEIPEQTVQPVVAV